MRSGVEEVRVQQMQVHNGFSSQNSLRRRSSADGSMCGSAHAHASLRRFAEGYSFGTTARLGLSGNGNNHSAGGHQQPNVNGLFAASCSECSFPSANDETAQHRDGQAHRSHEEQYPYAADTPQLNSASRFLFGLPIGDAPDDFASRALASSAPDASTSLFSSAVDSSVQHGDTFGVSTVSAMDKSGNGIGSGRRRRERHTPVFADRSLPVRERIERKCQPQKRLRDNVTVDALAEMMERVLLATNISTTTTISPPASSSTSTSAGIASSSVSSASKTRSGANATSCPSVANPATKSAMSFHTPSSSSPAVNCANGHRLEGRKPPLPVSQSETAKDNSALGKTARQSSPVAFRRRCPDRREEEEEVQHPRQRRRREVIKTGSEVCVADAPLPLRSDDDDGNGGDGHGFTDDDGTADELSFLVQQFDLEPETKQSQFMPYIS